MSWAGIAAAVVGAGASAYSASQQGGGEGGYDVYVPPYYNENAGINYQNNLKSSAFLQTMLASLQAGVMPPGMEAVLQQIRDSKRKTLQQDMYGRPGQAGGSINDVATSQAKASGVGPKGVVAAQRTALQDYADRQRQVEDFINQNKYDFMSRANLVTPQMMQNSANPRQAQMIPYSMPGQQGVDLSGLNNINWDQIFNRTSPATTPQDNVVGGGSQFSNNPAQAIASINKTYKPQGLFPYTNPGFGY